jgi:hypothetical protein
MSRVGEPVVVETAPPLPPNGENGSSGTARGSKIGSKSGQSRSRAREVSSRGDSARSETPPTLKNDGFDSEADEQQLNLRTQLNLNSSIEHSGSSEHPHTPINVTSSSVIVGSAGRSIAVPMLVKVSAKSAVYGVCFVCRCILPAHVLNVGLRYGT